jgi:hypothetical protein
VATAAGGQVTITGVGDATIIFDGPAAHGTLRITTYPNFQGNWEGSYQVTACRDDGQMAQLRWCDGSNANGTFAVGRVLPFSSTLTQNRTSVSGSVALGQLLSDAFTAPISGPTLGIQTQVTTSVSNIAQSWTFNMTDSSQLKGTGWFAWRPTTGLSGSVTVEVRLVSVTRRDGSRGHPVRGITTGDPIRALMTPQ